LNVTRQENKVSTGILVTHFDEKEKKYNKTPVSISNEKSSLFNRKFLFSLNYSVFENNVIANETKENMMKT
jgi:hypothetical protein